MLAIIISLIGLVVGIMWANKIWKSKGTNWFVSQIYATPDIDNTPKKAEENELKN